MGIQIYGAHYTVSALITNPGAVSNIVIHASALKPVVIINASIEPAQAALVTEAGCVVKLLRKTTASTVTSIAASTFVVHDNGPDASFTAGHTATVEGTETDFISRGWNSKAGFYWNPTPEEYILVPSGVANAFALRHSTAPPAGIYAFTITAVELG